MGLGYVADVGRIVGYIPEGQKSILLQLSSLYPGNWIIFISKDGGALNEQDLLGSPQFIILASCLFLPHFSMTLLPPSELLFGLAISLDIQKIHILKHV